jgi:Rrf2 family protein
MAASEHDCVCPAEDISKKLKIPKEFISKILQSLTESGLIGSKKGKSGGFKLAKHPSKIKLIDIVEAIDGLDSFNTCVLGFPHCSDKNPCPVHDEWGELRTKAYDMLSSETLDKFKEKTLNKIKII